MSSSVLCAQTAPTGSKFPSAGLRWLPSFASLAFILPALLLYWQLGGPSALLTDPNTGVHVRTGEWILVHRAIPRRDLFSFSIADRPWCDWEWLTDLIYALLHRWAGLAAVAALSLTTLCATSLVVYLAARLHSGEMVAFAVTCFVMAATTIHWLARPHLFTWLFVAVFCWVIEKAQMTGSGKPLLWLPALMLLWVNLHPGFIAGIVILSVWLADTVICVPLKGEKRSELRTWSVWFAIVGVACLVATFANPYLIQLHRHIVSYLFSPTTVTADVAEWSSPDFQNPRLHWFELLLPVGAAAGLWHGVRRRLAWCALALGSMHLALISVRNVPIFAIVSAGPIASLMDYVMRRSRFAVRVLAAEEVFRLKRSRLGTFMCCGIAIAVLVNLFCSRSLRLGPQSSLPVEAAAHLPAGRLFTTDRWADYLIYLEPGRRVFFDGRNDLYGPQFVGDYLAVMRAQPDWQGILTKHAITVAVVPRDSPISAALAASTDWSLSYRDAIAAVFQRAKS